MQSHKFLQSVLSLKEKYLALASKKEETARKGYILFDDGTKMPFISDISQFNSIKRWKKLRKQYEMEIKNLKKELEAAAI